MLKINDGSNNGTSPKFQARYQIQRHDYQLHENRPLENNGMVKPFMKGLLIHVAIIGVIVVGNMTSNMGNSQPMVETSLISANELAGVQSQIAQSRKQAKKAGKTGKSSAKPTAKSTPTKANFTPRFSAQNPPQTANNNATAEVQSGFKKFAQSVTNIFSGKSNPQTNEQPVTIVEEQVEKQVATKKAEKPKPSKEVMNRKEKLMERELEFQKELEKFTREEEEKARKARGEPEEIRIMDEQELIEAFKEKQQKIDNIVSEQTQTQEEIEKQRQEDLIAQELNKKILTEKQGEDGDDGDFEPVKKMSIGVPSSQRGSSNRKANTLQLVANKVRRYLHPPTNSGGDTSEARITVNARGEVIRVYVTGNNTYLNRAVEQAVKSASPLPIKSNDRYYPVFSIGFDGQGNQ